MVLRCPTWPAHPYPTACVGVRPSADCDFNLGEAIMRCIARPAETAFERIPKSRGYARGFNSNALKISGAR